MTNRLAFYGVEEGRVRIQTLDCPFYSTYKQFIFFMGVSSSILFNVINYFYILCGVTVK